MGGRKRPPFLSLKGLIMKVFTKPNGTEVSVNEQSEAKALALGWKLKSKPKAKAKK